MWSRKDSESACAFRTTLKFFFGSQVRRGNHQQEEEGGKEESKTMEKGMKNILIPLCQSQIQDLFL